MNYQEYKDSWDKVEYPKLYKETLGDPAAQELFNKLKEQKGKIFSLMSWTEDLKTPENFKNGISFLEELEEEREEKEKEIEETYGKLRALGQGEENN